MQAITTLGLDIAKSVFQVHGVDASGNVIIRRQLKRRYVLAFFEKLPPCLIGIEACASSHHWSRELQALGHTVRLMPPAYVKPYVKRHKNDATDAEAICEAVTRPNMRFVATKTPEQQSCLTLHRTRHLFIRQQTSVINAIRAHLAEFGIVAPIGRLGVEQLLGVVSDASDKRLPDVARACVAALGAHLQRLKVQILEFDRMIRAWHRSSEASRRLDDIPASVRPWRLLWLPVLLIRRCSGQEGTSRPGSVLSPNRVQAEARTGSAISANAAIAICAVCSLRVHSP
jgi:transposase